MRFIFALLFIFPAVTFSQTKLLDLKIDSVTSKDYLQDERMFTIAYHIENLTNTTVSFFLKEKLLMPAHEGSMSTALFYKLYQEDEVLQVRGILSPFSKKEERQQNNAFDDLIKKQRNAFDSIVKNGEKISAFDFKILSQDFISAITKLAPRETRKYFYTFYWDKSRYFNQNDLEYFLNENSKFYIELYLILLKKDTYQKKLTASDYKKIMENKTFIQGVFISNKMEIDFK